MFKLTVYVAAGAFAAALPVPQAQAQSPSRILVEDVAPGTRVGRQDLSPISINVSASARERARRSEPDYIRNFARVPTYPSWYESVYLPSRTYFASSYAPGVEPVGGPGFLPGPVPVGVAAGNTNVVRSTYAPISWGQAVPIVQVHPAPAVAVGAPSCAPMVSPGGDFSGVPLAGEEVIPK